MKTFSKFSKIIFKFTFHCTRSLLLHVGFLWFWKAGATLAGVLKLLTVEASLAAEYKL